MGQKKKTKHDPLFNLDLNPEYLHFRRTKIVASIGPSSWSPEMLRKLIGKGLDVARINFSHETGETHLKTIRRIRRVSKEMGKNVAILADLCGPKIRVGKFKDGAVTLRKGAEVEIATKTVLGTEKLIPSQYLNIGKETRIGDKVLLDDGNLELKIISKAKGKLLARVINGGLLKNHKGMNLPDTPLSISAMTPKDRNDVVFAVKGGVDFVALSFVRKADDVKMLRRMLVKLKSNAGIIAKIEKPEALGNIRAIVDAADGIMVARGDLGVELPARKVPIIQNKLIAVANEADKPVIVATQMLESMIKNVRPTRAEVTDVAAACLAGADATMMSAETAAGDHPMEAFSAMDAILRETETYQFFAQGRRFPKAGQRINSNVEAAIGTAAAQITRDLEIRAVFVLTRTGRSAQVVSADRPSAPILALTPSEEISRRMRLYWGVVPFVIKQQLKTEDCLHCAEQIIKDLKLAKSGNHILLISGVGKSGIAANSVVIHQIS